MTNSDERTWIVDDLRLSGLVWGPETGTPVLALHGWMDHADSFRGLAPLLSECRVVALDLSGQGHSGHRAGHGTYNIWDDLPQIAGLLDQFGWQAPVLLGHSRGANIAALLAAALPEKVRALVALDSLVPEPNESTVVDTLRDFLLETRSRSAGGARIFPRRKDYVDRRVRQGNTRHVAEALADRALEEAAGGVRLRGDPRLFASSAIKLTQPQIEDVLRAIRCPVLNIWGTEGVLRRRPVLADLVREAGRLIPDYEQVEIAGDHHLHLEPRAAGQVATRILEFLSRRQLR